MKAELLHLRPQLEKAQYLEQDKIDAVLNQELGLLFRHHRQHSPHFAKRLEAQGLRASEIATVEGIKQLKPFNKRDLQAAGDDFITRSVPKTHLPIGEAQTSGSTGTPVTIRKNKLTNLFWHAYVIRDHQWNNRDYKSKLTAIRFLEGFREGPEWGGPVTMLYGSGPAQGIPVNTDIATQLEMINRFQPNIMIVHAGVLSAFVTEWERTGFTLTELQHLKNLGDTVHDTLRDRFRALSGLEIEDGYSSSEVGCITIQCPEGGLHHVMRENLIVEILKEDDSPCDPGEVGRVIVTDVHNSAAPIIRYDMGDYAELGPACTCGRPGMTLRRVLGRERGMFVSANGSKFWPTAGQRKLAEKWHVLQWQIIQHSLEDIEYKLVFDYDPTEEQLDEIRAWCNEQLGFENAVRLTLLKDYIPTPAGKYAESICLIK